jgi:serine protease Do
VGEFEPEPARRVSNAEPRGPAPSGAAQSLGLAVANLTAAQKSELGLKGGVRVEAVEGAAARAGLREGDIILAIANTEVADVRQFEAVLSKLDKSRPFNVFYRRGEWAHYTVIRPSR